MYDDIADHDDDYDDEDDKGTYIHIIITDI